MTRLAAALALLATGCAAAGCAPGRTVPAGGPVPVRVLADPAATYVAAAVTVPGSGWEMPGLEGLTMLTALTLLETVRPALAEAGARAAVDCAPAAFTFTLIAPPDGWRTTVPLFLDAIFRPEPDVEALARARSALARSLALDRASPAWQARLGLRQALHGAGGPPSGWTSAPCGVPESIGRYTVAHVRAGAHRFDGSRAAVVVAGAAGPDAIRIVAGRVDPGPSPRLEAPPDGPPSARYLERNTVTAWVALAFPFGPEADLEALRLLGRLMVDAVAPGPERPDVFDAGHDLELHAGGGALIVHAVTAPASAARYAALLEGVPARWATDPPHDAVFERVARRHRGERLLSLAEPEARAAAAALELALGREPGAGWPGPVDLSRVRAAAAELQRPARVVVGPRAARDAAP